MGRVFSKNELANFFSFARKNKFEYPKDGFCMGFGGSQGNEPYIILKIDSRDLHKIADVYKELFIKHGIRFEEIVSDAFKEQAAKK
jgi:hypothetical protein